MADGLSRREIIGQTIPAVALGATILSAATAYGQDMPAGGDKPKSAVMDAFGQAFADGKYALPKLPYAFDALEPHIDAQTMELHHDKHQQSYVSNLNKAIEGLKTLRGGEEIDPAKLAGLTRDISFNAGGHIFHTIFFATMGKPADMPASAKVVDDINKQYGSMEKFKAHFSKVAGGVKGSGWAVAFYEPLGDNILITDTGDQDQRLIPGAIPILLIDVWEHAYYLKYQNKRADYIKAWWDVVNWAEVEAFYGAMRAMYGGK